MNVPFTYWNQEGLEETQDGATSASEEPLPMGIPDSRNSKDGVNFKIAGLGTLSASSSGSLHQTTP